MLGSTGWRRRGASGSSGNGSEAGSYLRLIDFVYHSTLGLRVIKKLPVGGGEELLVLLEIVEALVLDHPLNLRQDFLSAFPGGPVRVYILTGNPDGKYFDPDGKS